MVRFVPNLKWIRSWSSGGPSAAPRLLLAAPLRLLLAAPLLLLALALPTLAAAVPYEGKLVLAPGTEQFLKIRFSVTAVAVDPPGAVAVEVLPSDELFLTVPPHARGTATLLVAGIDRASGWALCLETDPAACPPRTEPLAARSACPDLAPTKEDGTPVWSAHVKTPACLAALRSAFARAEVDPGALRLLLDEPAARALYATVEQAVAADPAARGPTLSWLGPTLILSGPAARETVGRVLLHLFRAVVGRVSYDDRTVTLPSAPGAPRIHSPFVTIPPGPPPAPPTPPPARAPQRSP